MGEQSETERFFAMVNGAISMIITMLSRLFLLFLLFLVIAALVVFMILFNIHPG
ncbi:hypothetical protein LVJ83_09680 [Uruburuella testudinis]|uniref:Uncharacterized protein n=1 Tax=Uruburuella testudinis TaxID=1282863 RepID=A0ABY4DQC1_9NEIS|nr:hypothetical protein [Uruburuella testudinis]UOO81235.1 hypothetical protein LVJ83_09680 [Uruburuella testudinis]